MSASDRYIRVEATTPKGTNIVKTYDDMGAALTKAVDIFRNAVASDMVGTGIKVVDMDAGRTVLHYTLIAEDQSSWAQ